MARLLKLIGDLENAMEKKLPYISLIKDPPMLLRSLRDLSAVIGNEKVKDSVAAQVVYLIQKKEKPDRNGKPPMLNTILYGPPGAGKTQIGIKMARIWHALGYLQPPTRPPRNLARAIQSVDYQQVAGYLFLAFSLYAILSGALVWCCRKVGVTYFVIILGALLLLLLFLGVGYWATSGKAAPLVGAQGGQGQGVQGVQGAQGAQGAQSAPREPVPDSEIITITSREDFVGKYVGWSDKITRELLEANLGKVVFIDEAYSLVSGERDIFGIEAITTLNRFISEHPGEIAVIMAGYKDDMQKNIFSNQKGLPRRFMWHFECSGYKPDELFQIFKLQLGSDWQILNEERCLGLFRENPDAFPSFGGDTERLAFFAQIENSDDVIAGKDGVKSGFLTTGQLRRGIAKLRDNNIQKDVYDQDPRMEQFLQQMAQYSRRPQASMEGSGPGPQFSGAQMEELIRRMRGGNDAPVM